MLVFPPDVTLLIQLVSFFVLLAILQRWLFRPFAALLNEREQQTDGMLAESEVSRANTNQLRQRIEREMTEARTAATGVAEAIRREARAEEAAMYERAKQEAASRLAALRSEIDEAREVARKTLQQEATELASAMVSSVLGDRVRS
jgi:F-type H+-transporting ATPase subunit b